MLEGLRSLRVGREIAIALFAVLVSILSLLLTVSTSTPLSPYNTSGYGYSHLLSLHMSSAIASIPMDNRSIVVVLPLERQIDSKAIEGIKRLLAHGSTVVVLDEKGYSNQLLEDIGISARVAPIAVLDEVSKVYSRFYPVASIDIGNNTLRIVTYKPSYISIENTSKTLAVAKTSPYAYADVNGDGYYTVGEPIEPFVIVSLWRVGNGSLWLISDLDVFRNDLIRLGDNSRLFEVLVDSRPSYLVIGYLNLGSIDVLKYWLSQLQLKAGGLGHAPSALICYILLLCVYGVMGYAEKR